MGTQQKRQSVKTRTTTGDATTTTNGRKQKQSTKLDRGFIIISHYHDTYPFFFGPGCWINLGAQLQLVVLKGLELFLTQSDLSVENGLFRLKPKSGFLTQSKKSFFDLSFFD